MREVLLNVLLTSFTSFLLPCLPSRPRYWWWESVVQLQVLLLVAAEVFGRVLPVSQNALMLMAVLGGIAFTNMMCAPVRDHLLVLLEYGYLTVLSLTITLGLYFTGSESIDGTAMVRMLVSLFTPCVPMWRSQFAPHRYPGECCSSVLGTHTGTPSLHVRRVGPRAP